MKKILWQAPLALIVGISIGSAYRQHNEYLEIQPNKSEIQVKEKSFNIYSDGYAKLKMLAKQNSFTVTNNDDFWKILLVDFKNMVEKPWRSKLKKQNLKPNDYEALELLKQEQLKYSQKYIKKEFYEARDWRRVIWPFANIVEDDANLYEYKNEVQGFYQTIFRFLKPEIIIDEYKRVGKKRFIKEFFEYTFHSNETLHKHLNEISQDLYRGYNILKIQEKYEMFNETFLQNKWYNSPTYMMKRFQFSIPIEHLRNLDHTRAFNLLVKLVGINKAKEEWKIIYIKHNYRQYMSDYKLNEWLNKLYAERDLAKQDLIMKEFFIKLNYYNISYFKYSGGYAL